jgi:hypothetical protein
MNLNSTKIDFAAFETAVNGGQRVTLKDLAVQYGMKTDDVRRSLVAHFGARVMFVRGRTGGIRLA